MILKTKKDQRNIFWNKIEREIQRRGKNKDKLFKLSGKWKKFVRNQDGFRVYAVDSEWIRDNLSVIFGHGGHGYVHEFIPLNEIWVSTKHNKESDWSACVCKNLKNKPIKDGVKVSKDYFNSTVIHEISEFYDMKKGTEYWSAHQIANQKERKIKLLKNPTTDNL